MPACHSTSHFISTNPLFCSFSHIFPDFAEKIWPHAPTGACCKSLSRPQYETWHGCHGYHRACVVLLVFFFAKSTNTHKMHHSKILNSWKSDPSVSKSQATCQLVLQFFHVFSPFLPWTWLRSQFCTSLLSALHISALILFRGRSSQPFLRWCPCVQLNVFTDVDIEFMILWHMLYILVDISCIWVYLSIYYLRHYGSGKCLNVNVHN